jgi:hypothetical protein
MGKFFLFINETKNETYDPYTYVPNAYWLWKNVDKPTCHFKNVILKVMEIKNWSFTDRIKIINNCDNIVYKFEKKILYNETLDELLIQDDETCQWKNCPACCCKN